MTMESSTGKERTVLRNFKFEKNVNEIEYLSEEDQVMIQEVCVTFNKASFLQCNGFVDEFHKKLLLLSWKLIYVFKRM